MSVELEPTELGFRRPFTHEVSQVLRLHNPTGESIAFKVKTTAPKQYCVRPNSGRIDPGKDVEVQVLLQAMKEDPPPDARCRDKFLVQSVAIPASAEHGNITQVWSNIEQTAKSSVSEKKIRVTFLPADGSAPTNGAQHDEEPPAYSSPSPAAVTPQRPTSGGIGAVGAISTPSDRPSDAKSRGDAVDSAYNPATEQSQPQQSSLGAAASAITSSIPTSGQDLQRQLDTANAKIRQMQESASEGLRQRKLPGGSDDKSSGSTTTHLAPHPGGVPVQIVAALCLLCFLIAYLFF